MRNRPGQKQVVEAQWTCDVKTSAGCRWVASGVAYWWGGQTMERGLGQSTEKVKGWGWIGTRVVPLRLLWDNLLLSNPDLNKLWSIKPSIFFIFSTKSWECRVRIEVNYREMKTVHAGCGGSTSIKMQDCHLLEEGQNSDVTHPLPPHSSATTFKIKKHKVFESCQVLVQMCVCVCSDPGNNQILVLYYRTCHPVYVSVWFIMIHHE